MCDSPEARWKFCRAPAQAGRHPSSDWDSECDLVEATGFRIQADFSVLAGGQRHCMISVLQTIWQLEGCLGLLDKNKIEKQFTSTLRLDFCIKH